LGLDLIFDGVAMHLNDDKQALYKIYNSLCCLGLGYSSVKRSNQKQLHTLWALAGKLLDQS
jgi:hypothetical protein